MEKGVDSPLRDRCRGWWGGLRGRALALLASLVVGLAHGAVLAQAAPSQQVILRQLEEQLDDYEEQLGELAAAEALWQDASGRVDSSVARERVRSCQQGLRAREWRLGRLVEQVEGASATAVLLRAATLVRTMTVSLAACDRLQALQEPDRAVLLDCLERPDLPPRVQRALAAGIWALQDTAVRVTLLAAPAAGGAELAPLLDGVPAVTDAPMLARVAALLESPAPQVAAAAQDLLHRSLDAGGPEGARAAEVASRGSAAVRELLRSRRDRTMGGFYGDPAAVTQTPAFFGVELGASSVAFLIDTSSSMAERFETGLLIGRLPELQRRLELDPATGGAHTQLEVAQAELQRSLETLPDETLVSVISFSDNTRRLAPLRPLADSHRESILRDVSRLQLSGATSAFWSALRAGILSSRRPGGEPEVQAVVLLSDGSPTGSHAGPYESLVEIERLAHEHRIRVHTVAIGSDPNAELLGQIARLTLGTHARF